MKNKIVKVVISSIGLCITCGALITSNVLLNKYSSVLKPLFGGSDRSMTSVDYEDVDPYYYQKESSKEKLNERLNSMSSAVAEEGIVVLEKGNIPYNSNTKFSLFSKSSVDFVFGGTGSGVAFSDITLKSALENSGYYINNELWDFYSNGVGKSYSRGIGSINYGDSDDFSINEVPLSLITSDSDVVNSFNETNTGIFVLSRTGGEGNDLARGMADYVDTNLDMNSGKHPDANSDKFKSYLEPDSIELEIMQYINDNFSDFILIVNCNNAMELDFVEQFDNLSTIIQIPATGENGLNELGSILSGTKASSGKLADTYVKDSFAIPSSQNFGDFEFLVNGSKIRNITNSSSSFDGLYYMNYDESIYVGYRYFETRYADCYLNPESNAATNWSYSDNVIYPFGYGDSIASFEYSNFEVTQEDEKFVIKTTVTNTSSISAKNTVELFVSAPYGSYEKTNGVEKSSIELIDFNKTKNLAPGESEEVSFTITKDSLLTYCEKNSQYYLPDGDYYFTIGYDAHAAINNVLKIQGISNLVPSPSEDIAGDTNLVKKIHIDGDYTSYVVFVVE